MINASFNELIFKLPENFLFWDKSKIDNLIQSRKEKMDSDFINLFKNYIDTGSMVVIYDPSTYDKTLGSCKEYINFITTKEDYISIKDEEDLNEEKLKFSQNFLNAYGIVPNIHKYEISEVPTFAKISTYSEMDGISENTISAQYWFCPTNEDSYTISLTCTNELKEGSLKTFNEIVKSIELSKPHG